jgi:putative chitinase
MRAQEFICEDLDEGWKERIAAAGIGAAMTLGGQQALKQYQPAQPQQQQQQQQQQLTPKQTLIQTAKQAGITGDELAQLLAQAAHETLNFTRMREAGTPEYFTKKYEQHRKTAKILGNKVRGDGERYKGRGFIQLTGRDNYTRAGKALGIPLDSNPELAAQPEVAAKVAVWYWQNRVAPKVSDFTNTKAVTKKINPAMKHQDRRQKQFAKYQLAQYESA